MNDFWSEELEQRKVSKEDSLHRSECAGGPRVVQHCAQPPILIRYPSMRKRVPTLLSCAHYIPVCPFWGARFYRNWSVARGQKSPCLDATSHSNIRARRTEGAADMFGDHWQALAANSSCEQTSTCRLVQVLADSVFPMSRPGWAVYEVAGHYCRCID